MFPRHAGVAKKGEINDSTAEQLKTTPAQNTEDGVLALPPVKPRCKPEKLTAAMKDFKAYHMLRLHRINRRYNGKREKAARDAEAKKK